MVFDAGGVIAVAIVVFVAVGGVCVVVKQQSCGPCRCWLLLLVVLSLLVVVVVIVCLLACLLA